MVKLLSLLVSDMASSSRVVPLSGPPPPKRRRVLPAIDAEVVKKICPEIEVPLTLNRQVLTKVLAEGIDLPECLLCPLLL